MSGPIPTQYPHPELPITPKMQLWTPEDDVTG